VLVRHPVEPTRVPTRWTEFNFFLTLQVTVRLPTQLDPDEETVALPHALRRNVGGDDVPTVL